MTRYEVQQATLSTVAGEMDRSSIVAIARERAHTQADKVAYTFLKDGETEIGALTYAALDRRARAIAVHLRIYARPGDRVLLVYPPGLDFIAAFFGCIYSGVIAVPVYPPTTPSDWPRLENIMRNAAAVAICTSGTRLAAIEAEAALLSQRRPETRYVLTEQISEQRAGEWTAPDIGSDNIAFLQYTSGSTGIPKGVMVSHGNLLHNQRIIQRGFEHSQHTVFVGWLPLYHDMGLIGNMLQPLYLGIPSILMAPAAFVVKPVRWLRAISRYRATTSGGPNFAYELCVRRVSDAQKADLDLSCWDVAFNGSEKVRVSTLEQFAEKFRNRGFRRSAFLCCYGLAEATLFVTGSKKSAEPIIRRLQSAALHRHTVAPPANDEAGVDAVSCGRAVDLEIAIVDPATRTRCAPERIGEIWIKGDSIARGYWGDAATSAATFGAYIAPLQQGPFMRTGDLGFVQDGNLFITGRLKDLIIVRGRNYYPGDIESAVQAVHPALKIDSGAAFAVDVDNSESLVIVQELDRIHGRDVDLQDLAADVRFALMTQFGLPLHELALIKHGKLFKTSSGKVRRGMCREAYLGGTLERVGVGLAADAAKDLAT